MIVTGIASVILLVSPTSASAALEGSLTDYFGRAVSAAGGGEIQKALAMFELLLIPPTEVVVDYSKADPASVSAFKQGIERGFGMWRQSLGDDFPFRIVESATAPNPMRITIVNSIPGSKANHKGELQTTRKVRWNSKVREGEFISSITIVQRSVGDRLMTESEIAHVVGHELGHALGLDDSSSFERIMGPVVIGDPYVQVHPDEVDAVKAFRRSVRSQISRLVEASKR